MLLDSHSYQGPPTRPTLIGLSQLVAATCSFFGSRARLLALLFGRALDFVSLRCGVLLSGFGSLVVALLLLLLVLVQGSKAGCELLPGVLHTLWLARRLLEALPMTRRRCLRHIFSLCSSGRSGVAKYERLFVQYTHAIPWSGFRCVCMSVM